ncbi:MAG TPA: UvrD-helicase domain-containing protein [Polyangiaceae bacterium]
MTSSAPLKSWLLTFKPTFLNESLALPPKELAQMQKKLGLLAEDPTPDAKTKKQLKYWGGKLHRLRSGDYRIFYTFEHPYVSVLALRRRDESTYDGGLEAENLGGLDAEPSTARAPQAAWNRWLAPNNVRTLTPLPRTIDAELLANLCIEPAWHAALSAIESEEDLLDDTSVPEHVRMRVLDALYERPLDRVSEQADLVLERVDDLWRYKQGELLGFLLKLNPEQERFVTWAATAKGPTLVKGGPGTGKSTVALYRVRTILEQLRKQGSENPRVLFTTYTRALTRVSEQLLGSLLGDDSSYVDVRTADAVCLELVRGAGESFHFATRQELMQALGEAVASAELAGNALQVAAQRRTLESMSLAYLLEEILGVIEARALRTESEYRSARRPGRLRALGRTHRAAVWAVRDALIAWLASRGKQTWEAARARAAELAAGAPAPYDAVLIDEAQDLQPVTLRALTSLCRSPNALFVTADANQSIYGSGFRWTDVHEDLRFQGRTGHLRANHRSTQEIGEAAQSYLSAGMLEGGSPAEREYVNAGPLPAVRAVESATVEVELLAQFFRGASRELRLGLGACAVLCPFREDEERIAAGLRRQGVDALVNTAENLDLQTPGVKVITLKSAKGLEFPVVALAGFLAERYPVLPRGGSDEEIEEHLLLERRTLFVAMTRAMRALLVVTPNGTKSSLMNGFSEQYWNLGAR